MHVLVTAGNTQAPIDRVRCITNVFTGRTGAGIAVRAWQRGNNVCLLTSHPETVPDPPASRWTLHAYRTFDDLHELMSTHIPDGGFDAIIHCAAVGDYRVAGVFAADHVTPVAQNAKLKSDLPELWLRLVRAPKLVDMIRTEWRFRGVLVKFKLEAGITDEQLVTVAESSRRHSGADLMAANTLEAAAECAFLGPLGGRYKRIARPQLADRLLDAVETIAKGR
ncbi:MAG TPA: phosphopantothenoylcysteine decarboxylase [Gemmataceae bacterium]|jgi:phosphopantothenate-cysteine ligase/phosphopantothenoylcysteine decarboxylase/phosphopantothenate--cysteine ligase|nr:phosphopantothenoylcysteine decarboxylase [Gemmataceae bacterium]